LPTNADPVKVQRAFALGKRLFEDKKLSSCGTVSCASCHRPPSYADETAKSPGCNDGKTDRNTPTILNSGFGTWFHWDGHRDSLWAQAIGPLTNPVEMAATPLLVKDVLQSDTTYRDAYQSVFGKQPQEDDDQRLLSNFGKALAVYVRGLVKVKSKFDEQLPSFIEAAEKGDGSMKQHPLYEPLRVYVRKGKCIVGDTDIYAQFDELPTLTNYKYKSVMSTPENPREDFLVGEVPAGNLYIGIYGASDYDQSFFVALANSEQLPRLSSFTLASRTVKGGQTVKGIVELETPAPAGGMSISVDSSKPQFLLPLTITPTIPEGSKRLEFDIPTMPVQEPVELFVVSQFNYVGQRFPAALTITP
jgi:hypothetical protein